MSKDQLIIASAHISAGLNYSFENNYAAVSVPLKYFSEVLCSARSEYLPFIYTVWYPLCQ